MTDKQTEALKLALEALKTAQNNLAPSKGSAHAYGDGELWDQYADSITAIKEALEQPEQKPVAWAQFSEAGNLIDLLEEPCGGYVPLYTTPPQRTWVGLTDEDKNEYVAQDFGGNRLDAMDWAEKRLKEKNNGTQ